MIKSAWGGSYTRGSSRLKLAAAPESHPAPDREPDPQAVDDPGVRGRRWPGRSLLACLTWSSCGPQADTQRPHRLSPRERRSSRRLTAREMVELVRASASSNTGFAHAKDVRARELRVQTEWCSSSRSAPDRSRRPLSPADQTPAPVGITCSARRALNAACTNALAADRTSNSWVTPPTLSSARFSRPA